LHTSFPVTTTIGHQSIQKGIGIGMESTNSSSGSQQQQQQQQPAAPPLQLPPGFRFHPTDEELLVHYLKRKAASSPLPVAIIAEVDLYKFDPWELPGNIIYSYINRHLILLIIYMLCWINNLKYYW